MSRQAALDAMLEDMICEMEAEMEGELAGGFPIPFSCSGWESDPQSFSIRAAQNFCQDVFNVAVSTPDTVRCTGKICVVHYTMPGGFPTFDINVDLSQVPGVVTVWGTAVPFMMSPQRCSYNYSCDFTGSISFTRIACAMM